MTIQRASILDQPAHYLEGASFQIVVPEESTNLIANPSFETSTANWSASGTGVTLTRDTAESFYGAACGRMSDASAVGANEYIQIATEGLTPNTPYTLSFNYKKRVSGVWTGTVYVSYHNNLTPISSAAFVLARGSVSQWKRASFTSLSPSGTTRALVIFSTDGVLSGAFDLWLDGVQLEAKPYATTYIDGEQDDCIWMGAPHGSASYRPATTRKGGRLMPLRDYKFRVISIIGAGAAALSTIATPYANIGGAYYQRSIPQSRTLQIAGQFECSSRIDLMRNRAALIDAVNPNRTSSPQPARLLYTPLGCNADEPTKQVVIDGVYAGGLEGNQTNEVGSERAVLAFNVYLPFAAIGMSQKEGAVSLALSATTTARGVAFQNRMNGAMAAHNTAVAGTSYAQRVLRGPDGLPYVIGYFTSIGGVSANYIATWNGATWSALGSGPASLPLSPAAAISANGEIYLALSISATTKRITKWDGSSWVDIGDMTHVSGSSVYTLFIGPDGMLYVGGKFSSAGGVAANGIAKWDGSAWSALGSGVSGAGEYIMGITADKSNNVYAGGFFATIGGTSAKNVAKWNGSAWVALGSGLGSGAEIVTALYAARNGNIYAGGSFTLAGGASAKGAAMWNGGGWFVMGDGPYKGYPIEQINSIFEDDSLGVVYAGLYNNTLFYPFVRRWTGSVWIPGPVFPVYGSTYLYSMAPIGLFNIYAGDFAFLTTAGLTTVSPQTQTNAIKLVITGPGTPVLLKNYATGDELFFNITLQPGEVVTLTVGENARLVSNWRGDVSGALIAGSAVARFRLLPTDNVIAFFMQDTTGASGAVLNYRDMIPALDSLAK